MRYILIAFALAAALLPAAVAAQTPPPGAAPGGGPPDRAAFQQFREAARANALKSLSADHQAKIQAIVNSINGGSLAPRDAEKQIDALLTPDESKALLDQAQKLRDQMMALRGGASGNPNPGPPPGQAQGQGPQPNAGRFLLRLLLTPQQMRAMRDHQPKPQ